MCASFRTPIPHPPAERQDEAEPGRGGTGRRNRARPRLAGGCGPRRTAAECPAPTIRDDPIPGGGYGVRAVQNAAGGTVSRVGHEEDQG